MTRLFTLVLPFVAAVIAIPPKAPKCKNMEVRVEWRSLTQLQRDSYHKAVKCLQTKPSREGKGRFLYDRLARSHAIMENQTHRVAAFLPWHRYFSWAHTRLMKECGYTGPTPYWDWTKDAENMENSEIFDPVKGFGGNSEGNEHCVEQGPYGTEAKFMLNWPWKQCLRRDFNMGNHKHWWRPATSPATRHSQKQIDKISNNNRFIYFWPALEDGPHQSVLEEISDLMVSGFSPLDPLYFLHHNNVDRLWALWQGRDRRRLIDYGGNTVQGKLKTPPSTTPLATLVDVIDIKLDGFRPLKVLNLMDTQDLCYKYK